METLDLSALHAEFSALLRQCADLEALDYHASQPRDADGKFGSGGGGGHGGGGDPTGAMTPVGGQHHGGGGGDATREMTPTGGSGDHQGGRPNATTKKSPKTDHAAEQKKRDAEKAEAHKELQDTARHEAKRISGIAEQRSARADAHPSYENHERAQAANRIAAGTHRVASKLNPDKAAEHDAAATKHDKVADRHEAAMIKERPHGPHTSNAMNNAANANRVSVASTPLAAAANGVGASFADTYRVQGNVVALDISMSADDGDGRNIRRCVPPREFRLFTKGINRSTKGDWNFDDQAAKSVMARFKLLNHRCTIDYDHGMLMQNSPNPAQTAKSAGDFVVELREDGSLWAGSVMWTPAAYEAIANGEWRFVSPAFDRDKDGRPVWLINCAIVNCPALFGAPELQAANALIASQAAEMLAASPVAGVAAHPGTIAAAPDAAASSAAFATTRRTAALESAIRAIATNVGEWSARADVPNHPAAALPLSGYYDATQPGEGGGAWLGWIEPAGYLVTPGMAMVGPQDAPPARAAAPGADWICFVATDGKCWLWEAREPSGAVIGQPITFQRSLATLYALHAGSAVATASAAPIAANAAHPHAQPAVTPASPVDAPAASAAPSTPAVANDAATVALTATMTLAALAAPAVTLGCYEVVDSADYDYRRGNALASAEAVLSDPAVVVGAAPDHPAATAPMTGRFADPLTKGGARWLGWIEPLTKEWICFVAIDGRAVLFTKRQDGRNDGGLRGDSGVRDGAGIGAPVVFSRTLTTLSIAADAIAVDYAAARDVTTLSAVPYRGYPEPKDDPSAWDAEAALHRLRCWASEDGSGDTAKIDWQRFAEGFAYVADPADGATHTLADYKLPHHDVRHGELVTIRKAVYAAAGRIATAEIPEEDIPAVKDHLQRHYHQWGAKAPWEIAVQGKATNMHAKLSDYAKEKGFDKDQLKARLKAACAGSLKMAILDACGDDAAKHPDDKTMTKMLKQLAAFDSEDEDDDEGDAAEQAKAKALKAAAKANALAALNSGSVPSVVALGAALGLTPGAPEADVIKSVANTLHGLSQLSALTGESSIAGSLATVKAWKTSADEGKAAVAKLNAIEVEAAKTAALNALDKACAEKGLSPAQKAEALSIFDKDGQVGLSAYLRGANGNPAFVGTPPAGSPPAGNAAPPATGFTALSAAQMEVLRAANMLPGMPPAGAAPASESPTGAAATGATAPVVLSKKALAHCQRMQLNVAELNDAEKLSINGMTFDND